MSVDPAVCAGSAVPLAAPCAVASAPPSIVPAAPGGTEAMPTGAIPARGSLSGTRVAVIGAGVVGACCALFLQRAGADVSLIDRDEPGHGCSYGNSGAISPNSVAPLAMPGVLASVPTMLLDEDSPLHLPLGYMPRALPWLLRFVASARPATVARVAERLAALHDGATERHERLTRELGVPELFLRRGHLHLYPDHQALAKDAAGWRLRTQHGYVFEELDRHAVTDLEPNVPPRYHRGVFLRDQATIINPLRYVQAMVRAFIAVGGRSVRDEVRGVERAGADRWRVQATRPESLAGATPTGVPGQEAAGPGVSPDVFDHVVIATGAWSRRLLDPLGVHLPLESQRGYHVQFEGARNLVSRTVVLADRKVFITPMEGGLRVGGTVEIAGLQRPPSARRAESLERIARDSFAILRDLPATRWMGHRPCMPDSVPVIGPASRTPGIWLAVGHGHLGLTNSVTTAEQITAGISGSRD